MDGDSEVPSSWPWPQRPAVGERELAVLGEGLEDADDFERRLVGLVHDEDAAAAGRGHEGRIVPDDDAVPERRRERERRDRRVPVELDVLALRVEEVQEAIGQLVLPDALVADEEEVVVETDHLVEMAEATAEEEETVAEEEVAKAVALHPGPLILPLHQASQCHLKLIT